ncbi:PadR family transcriptional regulator [Amnibacterium endophyticum]|uniref:PadR family transcriptional regulator n=1 Tax=Amnibacterium endophyticum TaxID=2109337 RepID=A0ABW4LFW6_9MICO
MPRRRAGDLVPIERAILHEAARFAESEESFHGFGIASALQGDAKRLVGHGTLYKALGRMQDAGLLAARWESPEIAAEAGRPRRKLYDLTPAGEAALRAQEARVAAPAFRPLPRGGTA